MSFVSRGFHGRRRDDADSARVPPGQYVTTDFPVLSAGPTPHTPLEQWSFSIEGEVDAPKSWGWDEFKALPSEEVTVDIHCVTKWSKLDTDRATHQLAERLEDVTERIRARMDRLGEIDLASQDVLIEVVRELEKQLWMLRVSLPAGSP